jgi:hypothetical protein
MKKHCAVLLLSALAACDTPKEDAAPSLAPEASASAQNIERGLIVEGEGVAGVHLGMTADEVRDRLGPPEHMNAFENGQPVFMSFHDEEIFGVYFDHQTARVDQIIVSVESGGICTDYGVCLYREGDLSTLKARHGSKLLRFLDRDGSVTYRLLAVDGAASVLTEWTPVEARDGLVQVAIMNWTGPIDRSSFD